MAHSTSGDPVTRRHRPKTLTVFAAAFAAGAVLAYGVDRVVDVHVVQVEPQVESEPIFVALRSLPQGAPLTVWDVALKDWPKAMLPTTALKADASLEGMVLRHPIREGQPLLSVQLVRDGAAPPTAGMAALPAAVGPAAHTPVAMPATVTHRDPAATETFVPAAPADTPVAATTTAPGADVSAAVADGSASQTPAQAGIVGTDVVATDTDIDSSAVAEPVPSVVDSEAIAADAVAAGEPVVAASAAAPPLVAITAAQPAEPTVAEPTLAGPVAAESKPGEPTAAGPTVAGPLVAPVPALPTTDIGRSLAAAGRTNPAPVAATASVLDRRSRTPAPQAPPSAPRYHLVVPERVALAADTSFAQRPTPTVKATQPANAATSAKAGVAPAKAAAETARQGGRRPKAAAPNAARQERTNASVRKAAPATRPATPAAKPAATKQSEQPQPTRPLGLGAWFPQFSGGSRQR